MDYSSFKIIAFSFIFLVSLNFLFQNIYRLISYLKVAKKVTKWDNPLKRAAHSLRVAIFQSKILRDPIAGPIHAGIFWGFCILIFSAIQSVLEGFGINQPFNFLGPFYIIITFLTDIFASIIFVFVLASFYRRFISKIKRLQGDKHEKKDAIIVLGSIFIIVTGLLIQNSAGTLLFPNEPNIYKPVSTFIGNIIPISSAVYFYETGWWIHILTILAFVNYLPYSKHLHVYTSVENVFFSSDSPVNKIEKIDFEKEGVEKFGVVDIDDLSWKSLVDGYSCTHCGRCSSVCPANMTGKVLDPRQIIVQIRERTMEAAPLMLKVTNAKNNGNENPISVLNEKEQKTLNKKFIGEYQDIEALWQCTTCAACMQECPITIEHVPAIIGMRQSLVMMEANFPPELGAAFSNIENNFSPWAFSPMERADWAIGHDIKTAAEHPDFEVLFWVGCAGSFDDRSKKIVVAFSKLLKHAGINFAILGNDEKCTGDPARRSGNEYLADMLIKMNVETLNQYSFKKIVTICPHCFNTLKNEYPDFGGNYEVIHHTQLLAELLQTGKIKIKDDSPKDLKVAYHDACYMGRYNREYDAPREIIKSVPGLRVLEPKHHHDKGLCCGAGGARMFMEENKGKRVNIHRTEELLDINPDIIGLNCPFCMTMISDGVKAKESDIPVKDIAEILLENVE